ncbi:MAG: hypothetical protein L0215_14535 [Gemmataceae bacterium]|nr:hypothetical protein [Gemmataceae bacterium]
MSADANQVPEGAAVFPLIPAELGVHPLLLATLHAVVFFDGSAQDVVNDAAANEALNYLATYLQRLEGSDLARIRSDMECLFEFARQEKWPKEEVDFLKGFLSDYGIGGGEQ